MANFVKISSYRINLDNVTCVDYHSDLIYFIGGEAINMSPEYMQELKRIIDEQMEGDKR